MSQATLKACALFGSIGVVAALFSLHTVPGCACASSAQLVAGSRWVDADAATLRELAERRFPPGMPAHEVRTRIHKYAKFCTESADGATAVCTLPHDSNMWRKRALQVDLAFDAALNLRSASLTPLIRYAWQ